MRAGKRGLVVLTAILAYSLVIATGRAYAFRQNLQPALHTQQQSKEIIGEFGNHFVNRIRGGASVNIEIESSDEEETDDEEESPSLAEATRKKATEKATKVAKKSVAAALKSNAPKKSFSSLFRIPYIVKACLNPAIFLKMTAGYWKSLCNINYMADKVSLLARGEILKSQFEVKRLSAFNSLVTTLNSGITRSHTILIALYLFVCVRLYSLQKPDSSQELRSALEQKARLAGSKSTKGRKKMKPGQAKTLSDLPQLNT